MTAKKYLQAITLVFLSFLLGISEYIVIGISTDLSKTFFVSVSQIGLLVTTFAIFYALFTPLINVLVGAKNLILTLIFLIFIFALGNLLTFVAVNYTFLNIARIITAIVSGAIISLSLTVAAYIVPKTKRAWLISWVLSGFSLASVFGVPLGTWVSQLAGWRIIFLCIAIFSIITILILLFLFPKNLYQLQSGNFLQQLNIFKDYRITLGIMLPVLDLAAGYAIYTYLSLISTELLKINAQKTIFILLLYGIVALISNKMSGQFASKYSVTELKYVYLIQFICLVSLSLLIAIPWIAIGVILLICFTTYIQNSTIQLFYMEIAENSYPQSLVLASSFNSIFSNVGIALGSATGGYVIHFLGIERLSIISAIYSFLAIGVILLLERNRN